MILADAITAPQVQYRALLPILIVLGVATAGVLVEALLPAAQRRLTQLVLALGGLVAAFVAVVANVATVAASSRRAWWPRTGRRCSCRAPSCCWRSCLPVHGRELARRRRWCVRRPGLGRARLGRRAPGQRLRPRADRDLPAVDVRGRRHAAVPGVEQPAADVRRARGLLAAALPAVRARPPASAALAGGGGQVLPARRLLLRLLPVRHRARLRLRALGRPRRHPCRGVRHAVGHAALRRHRADRGRPAVQGRRGSVPQLDARRLPGRPDAGHGVHGRLHQGRRLRRAAAGVLRRLRHRSSGTGARCCGASRS